LRETLRRIAAGGMPRQAQFARQPVPLPVGAQFVTRTHKGRHGERDYKLYLPAARQEASPPLIVMLHGCTQSPDDFAAGTGMNALAEHHGFMVAYPAQPNGANASKCWNWFKPEDQVRDRGEPALIAGLTRDILRDHAVDPGRVYIAGLSAGGAAAAIAAAAYPDLFSAVGVHSGLPVGAARDIPQAFSAMRSGAGGIALDQPVPMIAIHGLADATVHPANGRAVVKQAQQAFGGLRSTTKHDVSPGGRAYRRTSLAKGDGPTLVELFEIDGAGHAWAGGQPSGSFTDPAGPDASAEMVRFFLQHRKG
jgi:poly(hydroxyalkanoate) depolymerase family esterase